MPMPMRCKEDVGLGRRAGSPARAPRGLAHPGHGGGRARRPRRLPLVPGPLHPTLGRREGWDGRREAVSVDVVQVEAAFPGTAQLDKEKVDFLRTFLGLLGFVQENSTRIDVVFRSKGFRRI